MFLVKDRKQNLWLKGWNEDLIKDKEFPVFTAQRKNAMRFTKGEAEIISARIFNTTVEEVR